MGNQPNNDRSLLVCRLPSSPFIYVNDRITAFLVQDMFMLQEGVDGFGLIVKNRISDLEVGYVKV